MRHYPSSRAMRGFLTRLAKDSSGNTLALIAAALLPLLAMAGSGVDMSRAYLAESRLQQACDAGTLAARKALGTKISTLTDIPVDAGKRGQQFFNVNFQNGAYGTENRTFNMVLESDYSVSGTATVNVPTSVMTVFGFQTIPVQVECQARLSFSDVDVMMVLDVTGSMRITNTGDTLPRIDSLKQVIKNFHGQMAGNAAPGTRIRYGFVPYSTNVNVGHLLKDEWVVDNWAYQSREDAGKTTVAKGRTYTRNWAYVSGSRTDWIVDSRYEATEVPGSGDEEEYSCDQALPASTYSWSSSDDGKERTEVQTEPIKAVLKIQPKRSLENGTAYRVYLDDEECIVERRENTDYVQTFEEVNEVPSFNTAWNYLPISRDVTNWRAETAGCIEERKSTVLTDFSSVDLATNMDLDINTVPTAGNTDTQWRPRYPDAIYVRSMTGEGVGSFSTAPVLKSDQEFIATGNWWMSACPPQARKMAPITDAELDTYLATLTPYGATYHDIGMIWGGRLMSQKGLFAAENQPVSASRSLSRHLIFLTDGQTEPYDIAYGAYGVDPIDERRWSTSSSMSLTETIEQRFLFACNEVKKNSTTVWVVAFGTSVNQKMKDCAGEGRYFEAANSTQLNDAFNTIAKSTGDLRISR
ncbi:pilus assembly protein TadG-related protein [Parerythrobacter jejuensis]|nr:pilus assembly protein TadG-related protein [Parerythrobacter jejuensis]